MTKLVSTHAVKPKRQRHMAKLVLTHLVKPVETEHPISSRLVLNKHVIELDRSLLTESRRSG